MTKNHWIKALFRELNSEPSSSSASPTAVHVDRWESPLPARKRQTSVPSGYSSTNQRLDDDLANYTRQGLQINGSSRGYSYNHAEDQQPQAGWPDWRTRHQSYDGRIQFPEAPKYSPDRLATPPPRGPREPLYTQEVPYSVTAQWNGQSSFTRQTPAGGFEDPRSNHRTSVQSTSPLPFPSSNPRDSYLASTPPQHPSVPLHHRPPPHISPTRPHTNSTPVRPSPQHLSTPPPLVGRPYSDPYVAQNRSSKHNSPAPLRDQESPLQSPPAKSKRNQCNGTTGAGKRCTRIVGGASRNKKDSSPTKPSSPAGPRTALTSNALRQLDRRLSLGKGRRPKYSPNKGKARQVAQDDEEEEDFDAPLGRMAAIREENDEESDEYEELPVYCFQHAKQTLDQKGTFVGSAYVEFDDWIPHYLPQETKLQLRHEISKPISSDDIRGYIYVHEMASKDLLSSSTTFIKLGRSVRPVARLNQWKSQCKSRQPIVRDIFPLHPSHPLHPRQTTSGLINSSPSRVHGALSFASQGAQNHHRWERLCLIEVAGIAVHQAQARNEAEQAKQKCSDCGKIHVELFLVDRGSYEGQIRDVVLRWQRFVETVV